MRLGFLGKINKYYRWCNAVIWSLNSENSNESRGTKCLYIHGKESMKFEEKKYLETLSLVELPVSSWRERQEVQVNYTT